MNGREYVLLDPAVLHDGLNRLSLALTKLVERQRQQMDLEAKERLRQQMEAETQERLQRHLAEMQRRSQQDLLVVGGVLLLVGLIVMSQNGG